MYSDYSPRCLDELHFSYGNKNIGLSVKLSMYLSLLSSTDFKIAFVVKLKVMEKNEVYYLR